MDEAFPLTFTPQLASRALETVLTVLHAGGKFGGDSGYKVSGGLHGVGISVVNALSEWVEVTVWREGKVHKQRFERGIAIGSLQTSKGSSKTGTEVTFKPDSLIFTNTVEFDFETLERRLKELAYLNAGVDITFTDYRLELLKADQPRVSHYCYEGGIKEYVEYINNGKEPLHPDVIYVNSNKNGVQVEAALQVVWRCLF